LPILASFRFESTIGIKPVSNEVPGEFRLEQNYPNPFNPSTNLEFRIMEPGFVRLSVYDVLGREVSIIVNQNLKQGIYKASFNAGNLPSGVYLYRLTAGNFTETRKMILVK
jgi:hypothetical protein